MTDNANMFPHAAAQLNAGEGSTERMKGKAMSIGVEPPRDANGKDIPLDTEILYTTNGQVFHVCQFRYSAIVNRWFAYGHYEHQRKLWTDSTSCFLLTPPDRWEKLEEDALKSSCTYFGMSRDKSACCSACPYGQETTGRGCGKNMRLDLIERAKRLAGIEDQEGER